MSHISPDQQSESSFLDSGVSILPLRRITVLVVDDHVLVCAAISQILSSQPEIKSVIAVQDYAKAKEQAARLQPDIILLDMHITRSDSIAEIRQFRDLSPDSRIVALADVENEQEAFAAIMAGAQGYRSKQDLDPTSLRDTEFDGVGQLTTQEREVLQLISQGYRDREIAEGLSIAKKTVQKHVQSILSKLGAQNRTEAAYLIHRQGGL